MEDRDYRNILFILYSFRNKFEDLFFKEKLTDKDKEDILNYLTIYPLSNKIVKTIITKEDEEKFNQKKYV